MDPRSLRTQEALENALLTLLGEKPLSSITVTEICKHAGVTRAAFYGHYRNTSELMDHVKGKVLIEANNLIDRHVLEVRAGDTLGLCMELFACMDEKPQLFSLLFGPYCEPDYLTMIIANTQERYFGYIERVTNTDGSHSALRDAFRLHYVAVASGILSLLQGWCLHNKRWPTEVMARVVASMISPVCVLPSREALDSADKAIREYGSLANMQDERTRTMLENAAALIAKAEAASK